jgi:hypothetical protein
MYREFGKPKQLIKFYLAPFLNWSYHETIQKPLHISKIHVHEKSET